MAEEIYLSIDLGEDFEKRKKVGIEENKANSGEGNVADFPNLGWAVDKNEIDFSDGKLNISGNLLDADLTRFGYLSTTVTLDLDTVIKIIEYYMKKLGKLKTVIEATK